MQSPGSHERALARFRKGEVQILLGTQMIAKGLDFPNVTLVGVLNADTALHLPDFRAAERTFQLLVQVAGRTGRGEQGGRVIVQTFSPDHLAVMAAARHDYAGFAEQELPIRQAFGYPPFGRMIRLVIRGPKSDPTFEWAGHVASELKRLLAAIARLREKFRFQVQVQGPDEAALRSAVHEVTSNLKPPDEIDWMVDVDPIAML
jgi:primosomal protein N' (replication factor Y)